VSALDVSARAPRAADLTVVGDSHSVQGMLPWGPRRLTIVAALVLLPLFVAAAGLAVPAHAHECSFDKQCLTCRWAADTVADVAAPAVAATPPQRSGEVPAARTEPRLDRAPQTAASRGPPPSA
jgi:hypothetical protein